MSPSRPYAHVAADGVTRVFGSRRHNRLVAVDAVSVEIDSTSMIGIVGESGSGKSTLARLLVGLDRPTSGTVLYGGRGLDLLSRSAWKDFRREVQIVAQDTSSSFDPRRSLRDAVRLPAVQLCGLGTAEADARVDRTLELLGVPPALAQRRPGEVSGGQRQRFALARALVVEPRLLVCDEVVSALDVSVQGTILNLLKRYCRENEAGLVFVSHGLPATAFIADRLVVMHRGRIVEQGATTDLLDAPAHPYTAALLQAHHGRPPGGRRDAVLPDPARESWACRYAPSCPRAVDTCRTERPPLADHAGRTVACHVPVDAPLLAGAGAGGPR
ncbi:hypothetical protein BJF78_25685 [Pseudonocardia sp. CNS-139]|nr:hypothetical protein BJF78_25685 [Pseudonocardia sp. CNS-139]